eukprot:Awhi_evm1s14495
MDKSLPKGCWNCQTQFDYSDIFVLSALNLSIGQSFDELCDKCAIFKQVSLYTLLLQEVHEGRRSNYRNLSPQKVAKLIGQSRSNEEQRIFFQQNKNYIENCFAYHVQYILSARFLL